jgi:hemolysin III
MLSNFREPVNGLTHLVAACLAVIGTFILLLIGHHDLTLSIALIVYGLSLVLMFSSSAVYHLKKATPEGLKKLRKLDHTSIYLLIAGTYTPICIYFFSGFWKWGMLSIIWAIAIAGILFKLVYLHAPRWLSTAIYLMMSWLALAGIREILRTMPAGALFWFFAGGFFYTFGAIIYAIKKPNFFHGKFGFHEIWHVFVILGAFSHYMVVAAFIAP